MNMYINVCVYMGIHVYVYVSVCVCVLIYELIYVRKEEEADTPQSLGEDMPR